MIQEFEKIKKVKGMLSLPGDKSISHRAVMFSSLAKGKSEIYNCLMSEDVISTINAFKNLGCKIEITNEKIIIEGKGIDGLQKPDNELYLGNSGTTTRLISGILAAQKFPTVLTGDKSLSKRPMKRIIEPLRLMGADIIGDNDHLPLKINPVKELKSIEYKLPMASAQVKSCVLLAGLFSDEKTCVIETKASRNHTETMLGLEVVEENDGTRKIYSSKKNYPEPNNITVPSDISTAAFFIVLTLLSENSELRLTNVSLNETRIGVLSVLKEMNGNIEYENVKTLNGEKRGDLIVKSSKLKNIEIPGKIIPNIIDEIPILSIAGLFAEGNFKIRNANELRHKESDRIKSVCNNLRLLGIDITEYDDGFEIIKDNTKSISKEAITFESYDDHRIAMAFSVLSLLLKQGGKINNFNCVSISNPDFLTQIKTVTQ